ncbi:MAG: hypothetical protein K8R68_07390 [Bacteroidales bacterium]|nr:hypothetical protein [Bacteroidales bacterium]
MPNLVKQDFLKQLEARFGKLIKLQNSLSLFVIGDGQARIYYRYSKIHGRNQTFYGLRKEDLKQLDGGNSVICFSWHDQKEPLLIPYEDVEEVLNNVEAASDGQIKASVFLGEQTELYLPGAGRINVEGFFGWDQLTQLIDKKKLINIPDFSHFQIQTLIGSIGFSKGYDVWVPQSDRIRLDWKLTDKFLCKNEIPNRFEKVRNIISEVDVIWLQRGSSEIKALFEVEHSTPIYSGLLRFNDLHLIEPKLQPKFSIVSNELRKALFLRQINRPTFRMSGLIDYCNFLEYKDVYAWFNRTNK